MCCSTCATATWCAAGRCRPEPLPAIAPDEPRAGWDRSGEDLHGSRGSTCGCRDVCQRPNDTRVRGSGPGRETVVPRNHGRPRIPCSRLLGRIRTRVAASHDLFSATSAAKMPSRVETSVVSVLDPAVSERSRRSVAALDSHVLGRPPRIRRRLERRVRSNLLKVLHTTPNAGVDFFLIDTATTSGKRKQCTCRTDEALEKHHELTKLRCQRHKGQGCGADAHACRRGNMDGPRIPCSRIVRPRFACTNGQVHGPPRPGCAMNVGCAMNECSDFTLSRIFAQIRSSSC